ncbi:hypothetical protein BT69DRAFT_1281306 [Atractiella rhizophila]|nr:hypothetical protein BT69DRAFT_1281306 [Atractiella rhizophila]
MASCGRLGDELEPEDAASVNLPVSKNQPQVCLRCKDPSVSIYASLGTNIVYCRPCFLINTGSKIRRSLELALERERHLNSRRKNGPLPRVVIAAKDNDGSRAMINFIASLFSTSDAPEQLYNVNDGLKRKLKPKIFGYTTVVHFSDGDTSEASNLQAFCDQLSVPFKQNPIPKSSSSTVIALQDLYPSVSIFIFCNNATSLAGKAIECISNGRGWALAEEVGNLWNSGKTKEGLHTVGVRPLAGVARKELQLFCDAKDIERAPRQADKAGPKSIKTICREFVDGLDDAMPNTVPTIMKTVAKVGIRSEQPGNNSCLLCGMPSERGSKIWREKISITTLHGRKEEDMDLDADATDYLCYGCLIENPTLKEEDLADFLIVDFHRRRGETVVKREQRDNEKIVKEFLIE